MLITQIFGERLLPMMEYVGWLKTNEGIELRKKYQEENGFVSPSFVRDELITKAHRILDQKMDIGWFVKPDDLKHRQVRDSRPFIEHVNQSKNWQLMFKGEWEVRGDYLLKDGEIVVDMFNFKRINLNAFATHCINNGIELIINKEYELNENHEV